MNTNPIFGYVTDTFRIQITEFLDDRQGCGKALIGAVLLDKILRSSVSDAFNKVKLSQKYFEEHKKKLGSAWLAKHFGSCSACTYLRNYRDGTKSIDYGFSTTIPVNGETLESEFVQCQVLGLTLGALRRGNYFQNTL